MKSLCKHIFIATGWARWHKLQHHCCGCLKQRQICVTKRKTNLWPETLCHTKINIASHAWNNGNEMKRTPLTDEYFSCIEYITWIDVSNLTKHDLHVCFNNHWLHLNLTLRPWSIQFEQGDYLICLKQWVKRPQMSELCLPIIFFCHTSAVILPMRWT